MDRGEFLKYVAGGILYLSTPKIMKPAAEKQNYIVIKSNLPQHKKDYDFLDETQIFLKEIPWQNMWTHIYDFDSNKIMFFSIEEKNGYLPGDVIEVFDKNSSWSSNNELLKPSLANLNGNWRKKANLLSKKLEDQHEITWNSGRKKDVLPHIENYKEIIPTLTNIYEKHNLPKLLVAHIIAESSLNPLAQSRYAQGISQIHKNNNALFKSKLRTEFNYDWRDFVSQAGLSAAMMNIAVKMNKNTYLPALTMYHAGRTNNERILAVGRAEILNSFKDSCFEFNTLDEYIQGLKTLRTLRNVSNYTEMFGSAGSQTRAYTGIVLDHVKRVFENIGLDELKLQRHYVENKSFSQTLKESQMDKDLFKKYNPHIKNNITKKTPVNTLTKIKGWEDANYTNDAPIWKEWDALKINKWDLSSVDTLTYFQKQFYDQGVLTMYAGLEEIIQTTKARQRVKFRQEPLIAYLNRLETQRPWANLTE